MCLVEHILECSVIVVGVCRRDFVEEERRRVQEMHVGLDGGLVEVVGLGLITCGEEELASRVHTLVGRSAQVVVLKEGEKVCEEVQEIEKESQGEEKRSYDHDHVDGVKDSTLEPRCVCR